MGLPAQNLWSREGFIKWKTNKWKNKTFPLYFIQNPLRSFHRFLLMVPWQPFSWCLCWSSEGFGSMFRISIHPLFNFSFFFFFLTEGLVLASSVCWTLTGSMLPSACEMFPLAATQPQSMMAPRPQNSNFNQACYQRAAGLARCSFANVWCWTFAGVWIIMKL